MADETVPDYRLHSLRQRGHPFRVDRRDHNDHIAMARGMSAGAADNAENLGASLLGEIDGAHQVDADVALSITAANRKDQQRIISAESADLEPAGKHSVPPLVIGARGQLGDIVDGRIGLDVAELAEIVDCMAAIAGTAPNAEQKQPSAAVAQPCELAD